MLDYGWLVNNMYLWFLPSKFNFGRSGTSNPYVYTVTLIHPFQFLLMDRLAFELLPATYLFLALSIIPPSYAQNASTSWPGWDRISNLFVFGDSYTTTGFEVNGTQPNPSNPFGNPDFPGRTFSNGRNWVDFLTYTYNGSFVATYDFAVGGAIIDGGTTPSRFTPMNQQVQQFFLPNYSPNNTVKVKWASNNTLFASFFGINDINKTYKLSANSTRIHSTIITSYTQLVEQLYQAGARNFLFLNVPPIHRAPLTANQGNMSEMLVERNRVAVVDFNMRISNMVLRLTQQHTDVTAFLFDTFTLFNEVLDDPEVKEETAMYSNTTGFCFAYST